MSNLNALSASFVWDDRALITQNVLIKHWDNIPLFFKQPFLGIYYRPIVMLSFTAEYAVWGLRPFGFHLTNLLLHAANSLLVFSLLKNIARGRQTALLAALLFAVHPAHKGVVAVPDRTGILSAFFMLSALVLYVKHRRISDRNGSLLLFAASVTAAGLGLFSKEEVVTLPLVIALVDALILEEGLTRGGIRRVGRLLPFFLLAAFYLWVRRRVLSGAELGLVPAFLIEPARRLMTVPAILSDYFLTLLFPFRLDYEPRTPVATSLFEPRILISCAALVLLFIAIPLLARKKRPCVFGILWYLIVFIPTCNIIPIYPEAARTILFTPIHFLYLPSIGVFLLAAEGLEWVSRNIAEDGWPVRGRKAALSLLCSIFFLFSLLSVNRNFIWKDEARLYRYILDMHPENHRMHVNLGNVHLERGHVDAAVSELERAVALAPEVAWYHNSLALAYQAKGWPEKAARQFSDSLRLNPNSSMVYANLAAIYRSQGKLAEAIATGKKAIELNPSSAAAYVILALAYKDAGNLAEAENQLDQALRLDPDSAEAHNALGIVYASQESFRKARAEWETALRLRPDMNEARENLQRLEAMGY